MIVSRDIPRKDTNPTCGAVNRLQDVEHQHLIPHLTAIAARADIQQALNADTEEDALQQILNFSEVTLGPNGTLIVLLPSLKQGRAELLEIAGQCNTEVYGQIGVVLDEEAGAMFLTRYYLPDQERILRFQGTVPGESEEDPEVSPYAQMDLREELHDFHEFWAEYARSVAEAAAGSEKLRELDPCERARKIVDLYPEDELLDRWGKERALGLKAGAVNRPQEGQFWERRSRLVRRDFIKMLDPRVRHEFGLVGEGKGVIADCAGADQEGLERLLSQPWSMFAFPVGVANSPLFELETKIQAKAAGEQLAPVHCHPLIPLIYPVVGAQLKEKGLLFHPTEARDYLLSMNRAEMIDKNIQFWRAKQQKMQEQLDTLERYRSTDSQVEPPTTREMKDALEVYPIGMAQRFEGSREEKLLKGLAGEMHELLLTPPNPQSILDRIEAEREALLAADEETFLRMLFALPEEEDPRAGTFSESNKDVNHLWDNPLVTEGGETFPDMVQLIDNPLGRVIGTSSHSSPEAVIVSQGLHEYKARLQNYRVSHLLDDRWQIVGAFDSAETKAGAPLSHQSSQLYPCLMVDRSNGQVLRFIPQGLPLMLRTHFSDLIELRLKVDAVEGLDLTPFRLKIAGEAGLALPIPKRRVLTYDEETGLRSKAKEAGMSEDDIDQAILDLQNDLKLGRLLQHEAGEAREDWGKLEANLACLAKEFTEAEKFSQPLISLIEETTLAGGLNGEVAFTVADVLRFRVLEDLALLDPEMQLEVVKEFLGLKILRAKNHRPEQYDKFEVALRQIIRDKKKKLGLEEAQQ